MHVVSMIAWSLSIKQCSSALMHCSGMYPRLSNVGAESRKHCKRCHSPCAFAPVGLPKTKTQRLVPKKQADIGFYLLDTSLDLFEKQPRVLTKVLDKDAF